MRTLTVGQPHAYLSGVLAGDAWLSTGSGKSPSGYLCLRVADKDFADAFASAVRIAYAIDVLPHLDERGYWLTRTYNGYRRFDPLRSYSPVTDDEHAAWLLGLFDSEGNAQLTPKPNRGPNSWSRRAALYSTEPATLDKAEACFARLGLSTHRNMMRPSEGHLGSRPVEELKLSSSQPAYEHFANEVGSNIARKQHTLDRIAASYITDMANRRRQMQATGVASRLARKASGGRY